MGKEQKAKKIKKETKEKKEVIFNKKKLVGGGIALAVIVALVLLTIYVFLPFTYYSSAKKAYDNKDYAKSVKYFKKCIDFKDSEDQLKKVYFDYGKYLIDNEDYKKAVVTLEKSDKEEKRSYIDYARALIDFNEEKYYEASKTFKELGNFENSEEYLSKSIYGYANQLFDEGKYESAQKQYKELPEEYEDVQTKNNACTLMIAESKYKDGYLNTAKKYYESLPKDFEYNDIKVSSRLSTINKFKAFLPLCGEWKGTNGKMRTSQIGNYNTWWWDSTYTDYAEIKCIINESKGTVTLSGTASYYVYTNYSSFSSYLKTSERTIYINKSFKSVPNGKIATGVNSKLTYSNKKLYLSYSYYNPNEDQYFDYKYTSSITYSKRTKAY